MILINDFENDGAMIVLFKLYVDSRVDLIQNIWRIRG